ncbi:MAG: hypothetical protein RLZZ591_2264 [Pseudomonadota bacterium]|jgi:enoyl-CoA hydratase/carnithine racemase
MNTFIAESAPVLAIDGPVATITLNRPTKRNRLENEDLSTLLAHFERVQADTSIRALVLTSRVNQPRPVFCAGYHLAEMNGNDTASLVFETVPDALEKLRPVTVCAMAGSVFGGATDLAMACDLRIGVPDMVLRMPAAALGLHYYPSGLRRFVSRLGLQFAKRVFLRAQDLNSDELLAAGYLDQLVPAEALNTTVQSLAEHLAGLAPLALQGMKQSLNALGDALQTDQTQHLMAAVRQREAVCHASADFAEGRAAFAQKRVPRFQGH